MPCLLDGIIQRSNDILAIEIEFAILVYPSVEVFTKRASGNGHVVSVDHILLHEKVQDF